MISKLFFFIIIFSPILSFSQQKEYSKILLLMGSRFEISVISDDSIKAHEGIKLAIDSIQKIENYISSWKTSSKTSEINRNAGIKAIEINRELFQLISRAKKVSELTNGIFDISYAVLDTLWKFDKAEKKPPSLRKVQELLPKINYQNILLNKEQQTVFLKEKGMKIGFGGIGKGWAADIGKMYLQNLGFKSGIVNAGGDLTTWGTKANGKNWEIGIADPQKKQNMIAWLNASNMAVVTSGNYEKFFTFKGKNYTHILNPKTGNSAKGLKSVTIICSSTELADALATAIFILGEIKGLNLINQLKGIECILVTDNNELRLSNSLDLNFYKK